MINDSLIVLQVRRAVLLNREDVDSDTEWEEGDTEVGDVSEVSLDKDDLYDKEITFVFPDWQCASSGGIQN